MSQVAIPVNKAVARAKQLVILGGGMSGLCFLHYLRNFAHALNKQAFLSKVILVEANNYMGGSVKSQLFDDGQVHELGPRSVRSSGVRAQNTICLLDELGLSDKVMLVTDKSSAGRDRYIYHNSQMFKAPSASLLKLFHKLPNSKSTLFDAASRDLFKAPSIDLDRYPDGDPPIYDFIAHRFGQNVAENLVDPIMRGITAGNCRQLSTKSLFEDLLLKEQLYGSVIKGIFKPPVLITPHDDLFPHEVFKSKLLDKMTKSRCLSYNLSTGLQTLPEHLSNSLLNTNEDGLLSIYNSTRAVSIGFNLDRKPEENKEDEADYSPCSVEVETVDGDLIKIEADHIVACMPAKNLAEIIPESMRKEHREALEDIYKIPHAPVGCVTIEYRGLNRNKLPKVIDSFGFLTHSKAGSRLLGVAFDSTMFPSIDKPHDSTRMTCMIGGAWFEEVLGTSDPSQVSNAQLEQIALEEIRKILKIEEEPFRMSSLMWKTGIAQYTTGHKDRLLRTRQKIKDLGMPLTLLGQSYDGVAINDVTFTARMAAWNLVKSL